VTSNQLTSVMGADPGWPFNRLVHAYASRGWPTADHASTNGAVQGFKGQCPCGEHKSAGRDFWVAEYGNGRVRAGSFTGCNVAICLETVGMAPQDLHTGPGGEDIPEPADDEDRTGPHLPAVPEYPVSGLAGPLRELVDSAAAAGLPASLAGGAGLGALAAVSGLADLSVYPQWTVRPCLWIPLIAPAGGGKTPAITLARRQLRELDSSRHFVLAEEMADWLETPRKERGERPNDPTRLIDDITVEMVARWLDRGDGTGAIDSDELSDWLRGLSRYRQAGGTDAARWLALWSTQPWRYMRVALDVDILISRPVITVCGGIQPHLVHLLGPEGDGMRPRFLPHLSLTTDLHPGSAPAAESWDQAIAALYELREPRTWSLQGRPLAAWQAAEAGWQRERKGAESPSTMAALAKADEQCARIALVLAESLDPGKGGAMPPEAMDAAIALTGYVLDCWRALPAHRSLTTSRKDESLYGAVDELADWLERRAAPASRREIQRAHVAGIRDAARLSEVLYLYERVYPGSLKDETPKDREGKRGPSGLLIHAPRRAKGKLSPGDSFPDAGENEPGDSAAGQEPDRLPGEPGFTGDSFTGDSFTGDSFQADDAPVHAGWAPPGFSLIDSAAGLEKVLPEILQSGPVGLDVETTGLDPFTSEIRLVQLAIAGHAYVVDCAAVPVRALQSVLDSAETLVLHDGKFDLARLAYAGLTLPPDLGARVRDTALASRLLTAGDRTKWNSLEEVAERHLGVQLDKSLQKSDWSGNLTEDQLAYAAADAAVLLPLREELGDVLRQAGLLRVMAIENRCLPAMVWLETSGAPFDLAGHAAEVTRIERELLAAERELGQEAGVRTGSADVNWRSPKQLLVMFAAAGIELADTSAETLARTDDPLARLLLAYRKWQKLQSTFGPAFAGRVSPDGRIHADWKQAGADPGRMSCKDPNLQQVPTSGGFRELFRAPEGRKLIKADYSQIELRIAAQIARDPVLLAAYQAGEDLHTLTAQKVLGRADVSKDDRQAAKAVNFGLLYGMGAATLRAHAQSNYGVQMTQGQAAEYRAAFFRAYPGLRRWHHSQPDGAVDTRTLTGRRRRGVRRFTEKLNTPVQGSGADGLKIALARLAELRNTMPGAFPVLTVHDEIVVESSEGAAQETAELLAGVMEDGMREILPDVPVAVETTISDTWGGSR
jgi:DNA polymerase I